MFFISQATIPTINHVNQKNARSSSNSHPKISRLRASSGPSSTGTVAADVPVLPPVTLFQLRKMCSPMKTSPRVTTTR